MTSLHVRQRLHRGRLMAEYASVLVLTATFVIVCKYAQPFIFVDIPDSHPPHPNPTSRRS